MREAAEKKHKKHVFADKIESIHVCIWSLACIIIWLQLFRSSSGQNNVSKALFCVSLGGSLNICLIYTSLVRLA